MADSIVTWRFYQNFPLFVTCRATHIDLVEVDMLYFNIILGMDYIYAYYASIYSRTCLFTFKVLNEPMNLSCHRKG